MAKTKREADDDKMCIQAIAEFQQKRLNTIKYGKINIYYARNLDEWLSVIKNAKMLISGRFHHSIAAYTFGVPYKVYDSNTPKTTALRDVLGHEDVTSLSRRNFLPFTMY